MIYLQRILKKLFDLIFAIFLMILLSPVILLTSILILITLGRPILFTQKRPGHKGKIFKIYKFRTMNNAIDGEGNLLSDVERITKLGSLIRKLSLDELPQLLNILRGELSFIGPRPLLVQYLPLYTEKQLKRHDVIPGISGWAQVRGRNAISWEEKFNLDIWYVENWNLLLDFKIFFLTIYKVLKRDDVSSSELVTMPFFTGQGDKE